MFVRYEKTVDIIYLRYFWIQKKRQRTNNQGKVRVVKDYSTT